MSMFKIKKNQIKFCYGDFENEADAVNQARDFATKEYQAEILDGKTLLFENWNYEEGYINFKIGSV